MALWPPYRILFSVNRKLFPYNAEKTKGYKDFSLFRITIKLYLLYAQDTVCFVQMQKINHYGPQWSGVVSITRVESIIPLPVLPIIAVLSKGKNRTRLE